MDLKDGHSDDCKSGLKPWWVRVSERTKSETFEDRLADGLMLGMAGFAVFVAIAVVGFLVGGMIALLMGMG